jgi:hypothetical protein
MLRQLIAVALTAGVAKKAWDHYRTPKRSMPEDITDYVARPEAAAPVKRRSASKGTSRRKSEGPSA